jgi:putative glutamine amidotransferase
VDRGVTFTGAPLIGVTTSELRPASYARPVPEGDPPQAEMALGMVYMRAIERAGGLPVVLPPLPVARVALLVAHLSGVCLSGGPDIAPAGYGAPPHPELGPTAPALDAFELAIARRADAVGLPVLGICRGMQALNVARGGTLFQHLPDVTDGSVAHRQPEPAEEPTHAVRIAAGSLLADVTGRLDLDVNSFHHQGVERLGDGLRAIAWAPDGTVEGIQGDDPERLVLGVQWHAEGLIDRPEHLALFETLVEHAERGLALRQAA